MGVASSRRKDLLEKIPQYLGNFGFFCYECLGYKDMLKEHWELCKFLQFDKTPSKLILMPRYSFKSCIATIGYALWRIVLDPNIRILIYSDSATKAQGFLQGIKNHITTNSDKSIFNKYFVNWHTDPHKGKWNESQIVVKYRTDPHIEPTIDTGGIESSKVGMHFDMILFDDIVSDLNVTTKEQMDKTWECYTKSLSLLKPDGEIIMVGTRWNSGDTYGRVIANGNFKVFLKKAIVGGEYPFAKIKLTKEFLENKKHEQGSYLFSCLYNNEPVDDSQALFKRSNFKFYGDYDRLDISKMHITCTCDPAGEGNDFTAITVVGTDEKLRMYVLHVVNAHLKPHEIIKNIIDLNYIYKFNRFGIETNFFKGMLEQELRYMIEYERKNPNFHPFGVETFTASAKRGEGKHARICALQPYHERGDILFPGHNLETQKGGMGELAYQMEQYTQAHRPAYDDALDALAYHVKLIKRGAGGGVDAIPENCIMAILERQRHEHIKNQKNLPRELRTYPKPMFA